MADKSRQRLALALDDLDNHVNSNPEVDTALLEEVSKAAGFSRQAPINEKKPKSKPKSKPKATDKPEEKQTIEYTRRRRATGRTHPFNTKVRPETYDLICQFSDKFSDEEDRPVSMAEVLERALKALGDKP